jgi:hypothetical protein
MDALLSRAECGLRRLREEIGSGRYTVPLIVLGVIFALTAARGLGDDFAIVMGHPMAGMFIYADDRLGDFFKAALSFKRISGVIITTHAYHSWPPIYQDYLLKKLIDANGAEQSSFHILPLSGLIFLLAAKLIVIAGLWKPYILFLLVYAGLAAAAIWLLHKSSPVNAADMAAALYVFFLSYPALWMLQRGNFQSGFTSILVAMYAVSAAYRRHRWLGWLALVLAVNMRPNVAILATLEFVTCATLLDGVISVAIPALASILLLVGSYFLMTAIYPEYTIAAFLKAQAAYNLVYIQQAVTGDMWNSSVYQLSKLVRHAAGFKPYYSSLVYACITVFAVLCYLYILLAAIAKKVTAVEAAFLLCAFTTLFTPVFALYHTLEFSAPLLLILADSRQQMRVRRDYWVIFAATLLMLSPMGGRQSNGAMEVILLLLTGGATMLRISRRFGDAQASQWRQALNG